MTKLQSGLSPLVKLILAPIVIFLSVITTFAQDYQIHAKVDLVVVPVSVQDRNGSLIGNLKQDDFVVLEDGRPQTISSFSIDAPALSLVVVVDDGMCGPELRRLMKVEKAMFQGLRPNDEVALFRYDHLVTKLSGFTKDMNAVQAGFDSIREIADNKAPDCPKGTTMGPSSLRWILDHTQVGSNGAPATPDRRYPSPSTTASRAPSNSRVLHDAVFAAATELEKRPRDNRKVVILISDGVVLGTNEHSQGEAAEKLVRTGAEFYAVGTDFKMFEHMTALNSYAHSTGIGAVFDGGSEDAMGLSLGKIIDQAREQYALGYISNNETPGGPVFRRIEVKIPDTKLKVTYRTGYIQYP